MQSQKQILTLLLISGASLLPLALPAVDNSISCYPLPSDGSVNSPSPQPVDVLRPEGLGPASIHLTPIGTCRAGYFNTKGSEIVTYEPRTERLFVINQAQGISLPSTLDVIDIHNPSSPLYLGSIDLSKSFQKESPQVRVLPTSVAVKRGIVAVAVHPDPDTAPSPPLSGKVLFYNAGLPLAGQIQGQEVGLINMVTVGYTPDMLTYTPNGQMLLVANTGLPPPKAGQRPTAVGSVSLIDIHRGVERATVNTVGFSAFEAVKDQLREEGVRIYQGDYGDWTVAESLQPEYIAVAHNSLKAWVSLEVNNAVAVLDIKKRQVTDILPLGVKDHSFKNSGFVSWDGGESSNGFDASDVDGIINITQWPVFGMYQPDAIEAYQTRDRTYWVTANEGAYFQFGKNEKNEDVDERVRVRDFNFSLLDLPLPDFPDTSILTDKTKLGNLKVSNWQGGDLDNDKLYEKFYAFSSRSFSIWSEEGKLIFDSGDDFERIQEKGLPSYFNCDDNSNVFDDKSDDQGVQPDGLTIGKLYGRYYVFVVLQRVGGIMVYDITDPQHPLFQQYINHRNFEINPNQKNPVICKTGESDKGDCAKAGDLGPEGVLFISEADSPTKEPLLVIANQTSSSTTLYRIERTLPPSR